MDAKKYIDKARSIVDEFVNDHPYYAILLAWVIGATLF